MLKVWLSSDNTYKPSGQEKIFFLPLITTHSITLGVFTTNSEVFQVVVVVLSLLEVVVFLVVDEVLEISPNFPSLT